MKTKNEKTEILDAQLGALKKRLKSGKPLTSSQMRFVEKHLAQADVCPIEEQFSDQGGEHQDDVCSSVAQLADKIGLHRQTISYHRQLGNAPGTLSESAWRKYFKAVGNSATSYKIEKSAEPSTELEVEETLLGMLFIAMSNALLGSLRVSLSVRGINLPARKLDSVTWILWQLLAHEYQKLANDHGLSGPFDKLDGEYDWPSAIEKLQKRLSASKPADKQAVPPAPEVMKN
jgi:hypothetical protein